jgi:hypothetical protein
LIKRLRQLPKRLYARASFIASVAPTAWLRPGSTSKESLPRGWLGRDPSAPAFIRFRNAPGSIERMCLEQFKKERKRAHVTLLLSLLPVKFLTRGEKSDDVDSNVYMMY